ncbi:MAG: acetate--CoA ligase family protein [Streptosporangiaceae bacterium]
MSALDPLFAPRSIAVVGASRSPGKLGAVMARQLADFPGPVLPVNGRHPDPERGLYGTVAEAAAAAGGAPDLAICCLPATATAEALREAAEAGTRAALVCAGGFAEAGEAGARHQAEVAEVVEAYGIRVLGPNTSGFLAPPRRLAASFVPGTTALRQGPVSIVAASGGANHAVAFHLAEDGVGTALAVGIGNGVDVTAADVLDHLSNDPGTRAIALYVESAADGRALTDAVARLTATTPVVALVLGRADVREFARSHTGALATSWRTTRAALRQAGAVLVDDERELVDAVTALSATRLPPSEGPGVGLVTAQAGPGLLLADGLRYAGVRVPRLTDATVARLGELLPPLTYQRNPVDTGRPGPAFPDILRTVAADPEIDLTAVYGLLEPDAADIPASISGSVAGADADSAVAVVGGQPEEVRGARARLLATGVPAYGSPAAGVAAVRALVADARAAWRRKTMDDMGEDSVAVARGTAGPLDELETKELLASLGVTAPERRACSSHAEAYEALEALGGPVVVKILDPIVHHKTEIGGVRLGVRERADMAEALAALDAAGARRYLAERTVPGELELIVGARRDPEFGAVVLLGLGGVAAEALDDVAVRLAPLSAAEAAGMTDDLAARKLLDGPRGLPPVDRSRLAGIVCAVGGLLAASPALAAVEINPLRVTPAGDLVALDALVTTRKGPEHA